MDADHAVVQTTVSLNNGRELALDYRMHNPRDHWRVYDLSIEGISMVSNYRAQFNKVIRESSYEALVTRISRISSSRVSSALGGFGRHRAER